MFVIQRTDAPLYYNEDSGEWGGLDDASYYPKAEGDLPDAPCAWASLWAIDQLQFARLLAEIHTVDVIDCKEMRLLSDSMDLEPNQVKSLFERAFEFWEQLKEKF